MEELPDSFDFRLVDRERMDEVERAIAVADVPALVALSEKALDQLSDPAFRRWPGRLASVDWCDVYAGSRRYFLNLARSGGEALSDAIGGSGAALTAGYAAPFFQADYALLVRGAEWDGWLATRHLTDRRSCVRIFRLLREPPAWLEVKIEVAEPRSFVSLGFLDGGILRAIVAQERAALERLLAVARPVRDCYSDLNWVVPASWLLELAQLVDTHAPQRSQRWLEQLMALHREAEARRHDILIGGWYGQSSAVLPLDWQPIDGSATPGAFTPAVGNWKLEDGGKQATCVGSDQVLIVKPRADGALEVWVAGREGVRQNVQLSARQCRKVPPGGALALDLKGWKPELPREELMKANGIEAAFDR